MMEPYKHKLTSSALAILSAALLVVGVAGVVLWQQVNSDGFGDADAAEVSALAAFDGYLYAGASNATDGALILRSPDAMTWTPVTTPGFGIPHDTAPPAILDLALFNGRLYASTGRGDGPGQIWRTLNGTIWAPMVIAGFSDPDTVAIEALAVYNGQLYAGATNLVSGAQIWRSYTGDSNSWEQVAPAVAGADPAGVTGLAEFGGALYALVESQSPAQIWRSYGGAWTTVVADGFGDSETIETGGMAPFGGFLYAGAGNQTQGAQLWRSDDGENWEQAITPGFGDANNQKIEAVFVFQNELYASTQNAVTGMELWRSADGATWEQVNEDGFGDSNNSGTNRSKATTEYGNRLYVGTSNAVDGGELWQMAVTPTAISEVILSPDDALSGLPGETVTYTLTITNGGSVEDTYSLAVAGNAWPTTLSDSSIALPSGAGTPFSVSVSIPPGALPTETDTATITATSQSDSAATDATRLTTTCAGVGQQQATFLPLILRGP